MPADEKIDIEQLQVTVTKLLDKAGTDVRLTPRLLREKVEQRMKLEPDTLRPLKPKIMTMIVDWWKENHRIVVEIEPAIKRTPEPTELESLRNYVRAIEKSSHFFRNLKSLSDADQADNIRKRCKVIDNALNSQNSI